MESQDTNFNYKITSTTLAAVVIVILITFHYSYAQSKSNLDDKTEQTKELTVKSYLQIENAEGHTNTNKAATIEKLCGCVTIPDNPKERKNSKVIYLQFLDPDMTVIKDNSVAVRGNRHSKRVKLMYLGKKIEVCDTITVPKGSLEEGIYTLNIFEDERLLSSTEFQLK